MFKWLFHILIFATSGKYQNKEKPLKRQRKLGLGPTLNAGLVALRFSRGFGSVLLRNPIAL